MILSGLFSPPNMILDPLEYRYCAGSSFDPPKYTIVPLASSSGTTHSRHVTRAVDDSDSWVLRRINPLAPGYFSIIRLSFSRHALLLPVPAGPESRTAGGRVLQTSPP